MGSGRKRNHGLQNNPYVISDDVTLRDAAGFAYPNPMQCRVQNKRELFMGDIDLFYASDETESADDNMPKNTVASKIT